jgi:hypothetical protein
MPQGQIDLGTEQLLKRIDRWSAVLHRGARAVGRPRPRMMGPRVPDKQAGIPFSLPTDSCTGSGRQMVEQVPERFRFSLSQSSLLSPVRSQYRQHLC